MDECFQDKPDLTPYQCLPETVPLDEMNPGSKVAGSLRVPSAPPISKTQAALTPLVEDIDFSRPDMLGAKVELYSRYVWSTVRGDEPFPVEYSGNHGRGLKRLGLMHAPVDDDD